MNTENSVKSDFSLDILQNSQAMVRRTLNWWQSTGDNLPPNRASLRTAQAVRGQSRRWRYGGAGRHAFACQHKIIAKSS